MTHLYIEQDTGSTEEVNMSIISKLYELASSGNLDNTSDLKGRLHSSTARDIHVAYLNTNYSDLHISADKLYITFEDSEVNRILTQKFGDGVGVTETDMLGVTGITTSTGFTDNTTIQTFNELGRFSTIKSLYTFAFNACTSLTSIDLSNIEHVGGVAFAFTKLTGVINLPNVISIGDSQNGRSFRYCKNITEVNIGSSFNSDTTHMGNVFNECSSLETVTGLSNITLIPEGMFSNCSSLQNIDIDWSKITTIEQRAFEGASQYSPSQLSIPNLTDWGQYVFKGSKIQSVANLGSITYIGEGCFKQCQSLTSVVIPNTVTKIYSEAFQYSNNIASVNIPSACTEIQSSAFEDCWNLNITADLSNITSLGSTVFKQCRKLTISSFPKISTYSDRTFTEIGNTSITIPKEVVTINNSCFYKCTSLTSLSFEQNSQLTTIGRQGFQSCWFLQTVTLPEGLTTITEQAFDQCNTLYFIDIPSTVTTVGNLAFSGAGSENTYANHLNVVFRGTTPPTIGTDIFNRPTNRLDRITIYVPDASVAAYKNVANLSKYADRIFGISQMPNS